MLEYTGPGSNTTGVVAGRRPSEDTRTQREDAQAKVAAFGVMLPRARERGGCPKGGRDKGVSSQRPSERARLCPHPGFGLQEEKKMPVVYATWFMVLSHGGPRRRACRIKTIFFSQLKFFHLSGDKWLTGSTPKGRKRKVIFSVHQPTPAPPQAHKSLKKMPQEETYAEALVSPGTMPRLKGVAVRHSDATRDTVNLYPTPGSKPEGGPSILS